MKRLVSWIVDVKPGEGRALTWSFLYFFGILSCYYVLRPLRDNAGITGGVKNLPNLFLATFIVVLIAVPVYGFIVARLPRRLFIPLVYHFFAANILIFWALLTSGIQPALIAQFFFVWLTVFSVFVVSVFWSFLGDLWRSDQGKRLYGFIAAGGSIGGVVGPLITRNLVDDIGPVNLFLIAAVLLEFALFSATRLEKSAAAFGQSASNAKITQKGVGGNPFSGFMLLFSSRYMLGIAIWVSLLSLAGTFLYLIQADVVQAASGDEKGRVAIFASIDTWVNSLNFILQFILTGKVIKRFGVGPALGFVGAVFIIGYGILALAGYGMFPGMEMLSVVVVFQTLQRTSNFVISNPAREVLFTAAEREEKYKAKNIIDNVVFRGSDAGWAQVFAALHGLGAAALALVMVPVSFLWLILALGLGRTQEAKAKAQEAKTA